MSGFDDNNSRSSSPRDIMKDSELKKREGADEQQNVAMVSPLMSPPPLYSANDYGIETICFSPKLVKSLMHKRVIRISSGGVHNICIVEEKPSCILRDVYTCFMQNRFTDVTFKGFH